MKTVWLVLGVALLVYGLHWIGQGTGWLPWPAHTPMDNNMTFTWLGLGLVVLAGGLIGYARRR
jgi:LPXTG-motif cell wall-anchored protein